MKVSEKLDRWMKGPQREYAEGLRLFQLLALPPLKKELEPYFTEVKVSYGFDPHLVVLVNNLSVIRRECRFAPQLYPSMDEEFVMEEAKADPVSTMEPVTANEDLSTPGIKIVSSTSMPKEQQEKYARVKEIYPLYVHLHAELLSVTTDDERKKIADELCGLDDERRRLWDNIDNWAEGTGTTVEEERPTYSDNAVVKGMEMQRRRKRLLQNISTSKASAAKYENTNADNYQKAVKRLRRYQQELAELEKAIEDEEKSV